MSIAYLFPGQGSQHLGMGEELFSKFPSLVNEANSVLGYPVDELCTIGPEENSDKPSLLSPPFISYPTWLVYRIWKRVQNQLWQRGIRSANSPHLQSLRHLAFPMVYVWSRSEDRLCQRYLEEGWLR